MWGVISTNISSVLGPIGWAAIGACVFWLIALLPYRKLGGVRFTAKDVFTEVSLIFLGCLLGLIVGLVTGLSRQAAIGAVVPAILMFIGALVGYLFSGTGGTAEHTKFNILVSAIALITFFFGGTVAGAAIRVPWDQQTQAIELYKLQYASDLERLRMKYEAELQRTARIHQVELDIYKAAKLKRSAGQPLQRRKIRCPPA